MRSGELAKALEPTLLRPNALVSEIDELCTLAEREHVPCVVVFPCWVSYARARLDGTDVRVCAAIAHPYGGESEAAKAAGAAEAVRDGAHDVEVVASLAALANGDFQAVRDELASVARAARSVRGGALVRAVLESCYLEDRALRLAGARRRQRGPGRRDDLDRCRARGSHRARRCACCARSFPAGCMVKAAGGIGTVEDARLMIEAGASRLGTTAPGGLLDELRRRADALRATPERRAQAKKVAARSYSSCGTVFSSVTALSSGTPTISTPRRPPSGRTPLVHEVGGEAPEARREHAVEGRGRAASLHVAERASRASRSRCASRSRGRRARRCRRAAGGRTGRPRPRGRSSPRRDRSPRRRRRSRSPCRARAGARSARSSARSSTGSSGIRITSAPPAMPRVHGDPAGVAAHDLDDHDAVVRLSAVVCRRSIASVTIATAVSKPNV